MLSPSMVSLPYSTLVLGLFLHLCMQVTPSSAIECYVCKSSVDKNCSKNPPPAVPASNCSSLQKTFDDWVAGNTILNAGIGNFKLSSLIKAVNNKVVGENLTDVTACIYFSISNENSLTQTIDDGVNQLRTLIRKETGSTVIIEYVMKDCANLRLTKEQVESSADHCYNLRSLNALGKLRICTCTQDKCNLPTDTTRELITKVEVASSKAKPSLHFLSFIILCVIPIFTIL